MVTSEVERVRTLAYSAHFPVLGSETWRKTIHAPAVKDWYYDGMKEGEGGSAITKMRNIETDWSERRDSIDLPQSVSGVPASSMSQPEDQPAVVGAHVQQLPPQTNSTPVPFLNAQLGDDGCLRKEWIDHRLAPYYATVLNLLSINSRTISSVLLHPVGDNPSSDFDDFLTVHQLLRGHDQHVQDSILACLNFRMAGAFFNGSCEAPHQWLCTQTLKDGKQRSVLKHRHQRQLVKTVYVMVGAIENCNIYAPIPFPSRDGFPRLIRTVDIAGRGVIGKERVGEVGEPMEPEPLPNAA
ncbi:hypothetical protein F5878DRAFT_646665 [Lentinula raphanica]|uniref:Uncharacterized protein n=1 Tax=Lentinula raphanica TaxID=153919 RepID=A0AA38NXR9_9AGAR|nr:hypothetical protein F5878DRAFT_646665 [Lentinula raphanica]